MYENITTRPSHWEDRRMISVQSLSRSSEYTKELIFNKPIKDYLSEIFIGFKNNEVLDVGSGLFSETYIPEGYSVSKLDWALEANEKEKIYSSDAEKLPFSDEHFGIVLSKQVYGYLEDPGKCLKEMARVTKIGGLLVIIDWEGDLNQDIYGRRIYNFYSKDIETKLKLMNFEMIESDRVLVNRRLSNKIIQLKVVAAKKLI